MPSIRLEDLSPFGRLALKLDEGFAELSRLSGAIGRLDLESESDLDHAVKLLKRFSEHGQRIGESMQEFSASLQEARERSEAAARAVAERAQRVQERQKERDRLQESLLQIEQELKAANASLTVIPGAAGKGLSETERRRIKTDFERMSGILAGFIETARAIKEQSEGQKFKRIERDARSMLDSLEALRRKIQSLLSAAGADPV